MTDSFWSGRRVLVTGLTGFLGTWLAEALLERGAQVSGFDQSASGTLPFHDGLAGRLTLIIGDITSADDVRRAMDQAQPQTCFHLAGNSSVAAGAGSPVSVFEANARGTWVVLDGMREYGRCSEIVVASSNHVYGRQPSSPSLETLPLNGTGPYAASKACADVIGRCFAHTYGMPVAIARNTNTFGGADPHLTHIVTSSIRTVLKGQPPVIKSDGTPVKSFLYVRDTIAGYIALAERAADQGVRGEPFNFAMDAPVSVLELVKTVIRAAGEERLEPTVLGAPGEGAEQEWLSNSRAKAVLGWAPRYSLEEGLRETIEWFRTHGDRLEQAMMDKSAV